MAPLDGRTRRVTTFELLSRDIPRTPATFRGAVGSKLSTFGLTPSARSYFGCLLIRSGYLTKAGIRKWCANDLA